MENNRDYLYEHEEFVFCWLVKLWFAEEREKTCLSMLQSEWKMQDKYQLFNPEVRSSR